MNEVKLINNFNSKAAVNQDASTNLETNEQRTDGYYESMIQDIKEQINGSSAMGIMNKTDRSF